MHTAYTVVLYPISSAGTATLNTIVTNPGTVCSVDMGVGVTAASPRPSSSRNSRRDVAAPSLTNAVTNNREGENRYIAASYGSELGTEMAAATRADEKMDSSPSTALFTTSAVYIPVSSGMESTVNGSESVQMEKNDTVTVTPVVLPPHTAAADRGSVHRFVLPCAVHRVALLLGVNGGVNRGCAGPAQSEFMRHKRPTAHAGHRGPPQSMSVSNPFFTPSSQ